MSKYYLTEAYGELYNPRKADETFYENLRFVDYLMQEEIEEVMESLLWEFMDYGNTLDESYSLIEGVFSDDVILEEVISEAYEDRYPILKTQADKARKAEKAARWKARKSAVTGALKKAGQTVKGAATGTGGAAMSAMRAGKQAAAGAYDRAKGLPGKAMAALKNVVRKGAVSASKLGKNIEKSGEEAQKKAQTSAAGASYGGSSVLARSKARTAGIEAASKTGSKRKTIGRLIRSAAALVGRAGRGSGETKPMTRADLAANNARRADAARQAVGDPFSSTSSSSGSSSGSSTTDKSKMKKSSQGIRPYGVGKQETASGKPYSQLPGDQAAQFGSQQKVARLRRNTGSPAERVPSGTTGVRGQKKQKGGSVYGERTFTTSSGRQVTRNVRIREDYDYELLAQYILEDFINEGYANNYEDALEILENLSENSIIELTEMYLEG